MPGSPQSFRVPTPAFFVTALKNLARAAEQIFQQPVQLPLCLQPLKRVRCLLAQGWVLRYRRHVLPLSPRGRNDTFVTIPHSCAPCEARYRCFLAEVARMKVGTHPLSLRPRY